MKDQYACDINDFVKYRLLRRLASLFDDLIVCWMLTPADNRTDGARIGYLNEPAFGRGDPELFAGLAKLIGRDERNVASIEESSLLKAKFVSGLVPTDLNERASYFREVASLSSPASLVFLDPDNGFAVPSVSKGSHRATKYLFWDELEEMGATGSAFAVYQHFPRVARAPFIHALRARMQAALGEGYATTALSSSHVIFVVAFRPVHGPVASVVETVASAGAADGLRLAAIS